MCSSDLKNLLSRLSKSLEKEGLRPRLNVTEPATLWQRQDGVIVGGWQWQSGTNSLTLFLGPQPLAKDSSHPTALPPGATMVMRARPRDLAQRELLPADLPEVVKRSTWLWFTSEPFPGFSQAAPLSQLQGRLVLRP